MINISDFIDSELWTREITPNDASRKAKSETQLTGIERRLDVSSSVRTPAPNFTGNMKSMMPLAVAQQITDIDAKFSKTAWENTTICLNV